jgi:quinohemoprotein ethanol dehydrogenase
MNGGFVRRSVVATLASLVVSLSACSNKDKEAEASATLRAPAGQIDRERLLAADSQPENWLTTGRDFGKTHYSPLTSINRETVGKLGFAWEYHTRTVRGLEASPIVVDGVMFTSGTEGRVYALDAATGAEFWSFNPKVDGQINRKACCDQVNRGVAVWKGRVYVAAFDGRLFALDAATGNVVWSADTIIDKTRGYTVTGAPEVAGDVVVIGNGGGEFDARGYVSAYDLQTGKLAWRFFTVPGDPAKPFEHPELEMAAKTWDPKSRWDVGLGGTAWDALVYDPELDLLYVGTGNAALWSQGDRSPSGGDNLFLTSILAIKPDTGRLAWHYQEVPGDSWDFTATQPIILTDLEIGGRTRKVLMQAPKNGFFYVIDRATGEVLSAEKYVPANWATHVDLKTGRPQVNVQQIDYRKSPKLVFPSPMGGHNWHPMAYSPKSGLVYIPVIEAGAYFFDPVPGHEYRPGLSNIGVVPLFSGGVGLGNMPLPPQVRTVLESGELTKGQPDTRMRALLRAWDPLQHKVVWEVETSGWWDRAGVLATAGDLVFHGSATGHLRMYDAAGGKLLKEIDTGTSIMAAPVTYAVNGEQYIAVMAAFGGGGWATPHATSAAYKYGNAGRILAFKIGGATVPKPNPLPPVPPIPKPPALTASPETIARGGMLFGQNCASCHSNVPRSAAPDLRRMAPAVHQTFDDIVLRGQRRALGMPQWDDVLKPEDSQAIHSFLISLAWEAYNAEQSGASANTPRNITSH